MADLNAHEAGNGGQSQGKPTACGVLLYSEGYDRIVGVLANLGHHISDQTVGNILRRHDIAPAPRRSQTTTWKEFIRRHMDVLAGTDFFTVEVLTWRGLVTY
jgi:putative transposase